LRVLSRNNLFSMRSCKFRIAADQHLVSGRIFPTSIAVKMAALEFANSVQ
jgi:hypothetical protein